MRCRVGGEPFGASAGAGAQRIDKRQFQIFDLYAVKGWSPTEVAWAECRACLSDQASRLGYSEEESTSIGT